MATGPADGTQGPSACSGKHLLIYKKIQTKSLLMNAIYKFQISMLIMGRLSVEIFPQQEIKASKLLLILASVFNEP